MSGSGVGGDGSNKDRISSEMRTMMHFMMEERLRNKPIEAGSGKIKKKRKLKKLYGKSIRSINRTLIWKGNPKKNWKNQERWIKNTTRKFSGFYNSSIVYKKSFTRNRSLEYLEGMMKRQFISLPEIAETVFYGYYYRRTYEHPINNMKIQRHFLKPTTNNSNIELIVMQTIRTETKESIIKETLMEDSSYLQNKTGISHDNLYMEIFLKNNVKRKDKLKIRKSILIPMTCQHKYLLQQLKQYPGHILKLEYSLAEWNVETPLKYTGKFTYDKTGKYVSKINIKHFGVYRTTGALIDGLTDVLQSGGKR